MKSIKKSPSKEGRTKHYQAKPKASAIKKLKSKAKRVNGKGRMTLSVKGRNASKKVKLNRFTGNEHQGITESTMTQLIIHRQMHTTRWVDGKKVQTRTLVEGTDVGVVTDFFVKEPVRLKKVEEVTAEMELQRKKEKVIVSRGRAKADRKVNHPRRRGYLRRKHIVEVDGSPMRIRRGDKSTPNRRAINPIPMDRVWRRYELKTLAPTGEVLMKAYLLRKQQRLEAKDDQYQKARDRLEVRNNSKDVPITRAVSGRQDARDARGLNHLADQPAFIHERDSRKQLLKLCRKSDQHSKGTQARRFNTKSIPKKPRKADRKPVRTSRMDLRFAMIKALESVPFVKKDEYLPMVSGKAKLKRDELRPGGCGRKVLDAQMEKSVIRTTKHRNGFIDAKALVAKSIVSARKGKTLNAVPVHEITDAIKGEIPRVARTIANEMVAELRKTIAQEKKDEETRKEASHNLYTKEERVARKLRKAKRVSEANLKLRKFIANKDSKDQ